MWPSLGNIGGVPLTTWAPFALLGIWAAFFSIRREFRDVPVSGTALTGIFAGGVVAWFAGSYVAHALTVGRSAAGGALFSGFVLYGGVIGVVLYGAGVFLFGPLKGKARVSELWDRLGPPVAWAIVFGRLGCTFYGCCHGTPSGSWPGYKLNFEHWDFKYRQFPMELKDVSLHPATLYESLGMACVIGINELLKRRKKPLAIGARGWIIWLSYAALRFLLEFIRGDVRGNPLYGLYPSQWISAVILIGGGALLYDDIRRNRKPLLRTKS